MALTPHSALEEEPVAATPQAGYVSLLHRGTANRIQDDDVLFWKQDERHGALSNWYASPIRYEIRGKSHVYASGENLFMAIKADFFGDGIALAKLQASDLSPKDCKALGRGVEGYNESKWCKARVKVMDEVLAAKFEQNPSLAKTLRRWKAWQTI